jgi:hypothetical protein
MRLFADVGVTQDVETLGIRGHQTVLNSVVHHLDEVSGAVGTAVQVALLGGSTNLLASRRAWDVATREQVAQSVEEFRLLVRRAREAVEKSVSLYEFTKPLQEAFTALNLQGKEKPADVDGGLEG